MAWVTILDGNSNSIGWEYDDAVETAGVKTTPQGVEIYAKCRPIGSTKETQGEINKTFWDNHNKDTQLVWQ